MSIAATLCRPLSALLLIGAIACAASQTASAQAIIPREGVSFRIDSTSIYQEKFDSAKRTALEQIITAFLDSLCQETFAYLEWVAESDTGIDSGLVGSLEFLLQGEMDTDNRRERSIINLVSVVGDQSTPVQNWIPQVVIGFSEIPPSGVETLTRIIKNSLLEMFTNSDLPTNLQNSVLSLLPLADSVIVDTTFSQFILIPLSWYALKASDNSILSIEFESAPPDLNSQKGDCTVFAFDMVPGDNWGGMVLGRLDSFKYLHPQLMVYVKDGAWDNRIPTILKNAVKGKTRVRMTRYYRDYTHGQTGGLADIR